MQKRLLAILLALALVLTGLAGCGKQETVMPEATVAKGRYVEQELSLPTLGYPLDMTTLEDGRLRLGLMTGEREYRFFTPPNFAAFDDIGKEYEKRFKTLLASRREAYLDGGDTGTETALAEIRK